MCTNDATTTEAPSANRRREIGNHPAVIGIPGSPPWFSCQQCGAYRSTQAGLRDLPCEPDRYDNIEPSDRISVGDQLRARVDQTLEQDDGSRVVMGHTAQSGIRFVIETSDWTVARGDEIEVRFDALDDECDATICRVISTDDRVPSPTLTYVGSDTEDGSNTR